MPQASRRQSNRPSSKQSSKQSDSKQDETDRYRRAAEDALQQLDWAIGYLHGIRKTEISRALAKNRTFIRKRLMGQAEEPMPTEQTDQT
jgi:hypothetical protein